jgi:hypothetical protein
MAVQNQKVVERALAELREQAKTKPVPLMTNDVQRTRTRAPIVHTVKSWTYLYEANTSGRKTHDIRVMDRDYQVGDFLLMQEYHWGNQSYTGRQALFEISYITSAKVGVPNAPACAFSPTCLHPDYAVLSIRKVDDREKIGG